MMVVDPVTSVSFVRVVEVVRVPSSVSNVTLVLRVWAAGRRVLVQSVTLVD